MTKFTSTIRVYSAQTRRRDCYNGEHDGINVLMKHGTCVLQTFENYTAQQIQYILPKELRIISVVFYKETIQTRKW